MWGMAPHRYGVFLPLVGLEWTQLRERVLEIEALGYGSVWLDDHFWFPGAPDRDHLEVWTVLSALAAVTHRIALGPLVLAQSFRSPGLLGKMSASLSQVAGGRLQLGLGAGWMEEEYRAYGYELPPPRERVDQLGEAVEILRRLWRDERATYAGRHHRISDAPCRPKPLSLPLLLGGSGDRLLALAARHADGWNSPNPAWRDLAAKRERLHRLCESNGRDPHTIAVSEQVIVVVGATERDAARELEHARRALAGFAQFDGDVHVGTPEKVAEALRERIALGVDAFMVMFGDHGSREQIALFADRVLPLLPA
jgi:alkanesulfonate monooxygenase SsuD/methylene tetrahydromethanopterin reductase-like flavin-dependent oxidoreductase (luciferase family)